MPLCALGKGQQVQGAVRCEVLGHVTISGLVGIRAQHDSSYSSLSESLAGWRFPRGSPMPYFNSVSCGLCAAKPGRVSRPRNKT